MDYVRKTMNSRAEIDVNKLCGQVAEALNNAEIGLPEEVFRFVESVTPMVNVDLLVIRNNKVLLAWRDDGKNLGWHIPGGIVRFKESFNERIIKTAQKELGTEVLCDDRILKISNINMPYQTGGHFISFLFRCSVPDDYKIDNSDRSEHSDGYLKWFCEEPELVDGQACYRGIIDYYLHCEGEVR